MHGADGIRDQNTNERPIGQNSQKDTYWSKHTKILYCFQHQTLLCVCVVSVPTLVVIGPPPSELVFSTSLCPELNLALLLSLC